MRARTGVRPGHVVAAPAPVREIPRRRGRSTVRGPSHHVFGPSPNVSGRCKELQADISLAFGIVQAYARFRRVPARLPWISARGRLVGRQREGASDEACLSGRRSCAGRTSVRRRTSGGGIESRAVQGAGLHEGDRGDARVHSGRRERDQGARQAASVRGAGDRQDRPVHDADLESYRVIVFLNTSGDVLSDDEQGAFERWFQAGGGFVGIHSAIETEPEWTFLDDILGARATGEAELDEATIKVADRVHDASRTLPERWVALGPLLQLRHQRPRRLPRPRHRRRDELRRRHDGLRPSVRLVQGHRRAAAPSTRRAATPPPRSPSRTSASTCVGALDWAAGIADPVYSDCGATVLANYQQVKISAPPNLNEPIGFDQFPDGRLIQTTRDGRVRLHDPATGDVDVIANIPVYTVNEDGLYGPAVDTTSRRTSGSTSSTRRWRWRGISQSGVPVPGQHAARRRAGHGARPERVGPVERLLPALALQVRRGRRGRSRRASTPRPSRRS